MADTEKCPFCKSIPKSFKRTSNTRLLALFKCQIYDFVEDTDEQEFCADLYDMTRDYVDRDEREQAIFKRSNFKDEDQEYIRPGSIFFWSIRDDETYDFEFINYGLWTQEEIDDIYRKAKEDYKFLFTEYCPECESTYADGFTLRRWDCNACSEYNKTHGLI